MQTDSTSTDRLIAEERRRRIVEMVAEAGSVKVADLARDLQVGINTVRNDLDYLHSDGKLLRVHGGAVTCHESSPRPPYNQTRGSNLVEKTAIGVTASGLVPENGTVFIGSGSTTYQLAAHIPKVNNIHIITNAIDTAALVASDNLCTVDFIGGRISPDSLESDMSLSDQSISELYWDVSFLGAAAIDIERGITSLDRTSASWEKMVIDRGAKNIVLCDSSKLGKFSYAKAGDVTDIDILVTDSGASPDFLKELEKHGVETVVATIE